MCPSQAVNLFSLQPVYHTKSAAVCQAKRLTDPSFFYLHFDDNMLKLRNKIKCSRALRRRCIAKEDAYETSDRLCAGAVSDGLSVFRSPQPAVSRDGIVKWTMPLATSVDLIEMTHAEETADGPKNLLQQNVLTYEPNLTVRPMVIYGSTLYGRSTMSKIAAYLEDENLSLVAGVNGSFFDMSTRHSLRLRCNGRRSSHERQRQLRRFQQKRRCYYRKSGRAHLCKRWPAQ